ncbi:MAG TPA: nuclear transport factor 2 family protein [Rhizomicrobium sp.]|nr:nuclear transport factor 2 family protein [Rhizomicrobium sp.]
MRILFFVALIATAPAAAADLKAEMRQLEHARGAAIAADDETALSKLYAPDFSGIAASGVLVTRDDLFGVFRRAHAQSTALTADSTILDARDLGGGAVVVTGRLKLRAPDTKALVSESLYMHIFRKDAAGWHMVTGASTPVAR